MDQREIALVTGAAGDIGAAVARELSDRGATVICADIEPGDGVSLDVTSADAWAAALGAIEAEHGRLDILVSAAGVEGPSAPLWEQPPGEFMRVMEVNAGGVFLGMRHALPLMQRTGRGAIVNVASVAGLVGVVGLAPYAASKHAVVGLTRTAAAEVARMGIRVNAVCPGPVEGRMIRAIEAGGRPKAPERLRAAYEAAIPARRYGLPGEIAATVAWLSSSAAAYLTGAAVPVDGGMSAV